MNQWKFCNEIKLHKIETSCYLWQEVTYTSLKNLLRVILLTAELAWSLKPKQHSLGITYFH